MTSKPATLPATLPVLPEQAAATLPTRPVPPGLDPLETIRDAYNVPARLGMAVIVDGRRARITGVNGTSLECTEVETGTVFITHPTWMITYLHTPTEQEARDWAVFERLAREKRTVDVAVEEPENRARVTVRFPDPGREGTEEQLLHLLDEVLAPEPEAGA